MGERMYQGGGEPPPSVTVGIAVDVSRFTDAIRQSGLALRSAFGVAIKAAADFDQAMSRVRVAWDHPHARGLADLEAVGWALMAPERREVRLAGLEARYFVRGSLDTRYRAARHRDALVKAILRGEELPWLRAEERAVVATAFIVGWVEHQGKDMPTMTPRWVDDDPAELEAWYATTMVPVPRNGIQPDGAVIP